jgi:addiction module RelE/StbE family toxin
VLIYHSKGFAKAYKKLPQTVKTLAEDKEDIFRQNLFDPRLKTHKLSGKLSEFYVFSISNHWRIVFHFEDEQTVIFDMIGTHEIYRWAIRYKVLDTI